MRLLINVKDESILEKLMWMLKHFKSDGVEIVQELPTNQTNIEYSDEYIEKNWREIVSNALSSYDEDYYNSEQYKVDRGSYLTERQK